uniref:Uncharacterized protein n=1 Tax=Utricularia reniformis TaxID=192314 RepID=A0A1Y0B3N4_9LAMI|nr:hypothetical protein AEK19_MT1833 [Utricularia reniformis]ART32004.1 hypothetical protein AEK19_MT1833 [Utricularia reniformis]
MAMCIHRESIGIFLQSLALSYSIFVVVALLSIRRATGQKDLPQRHMDSMLLERRFLLGLQLQDRFLDLQ